MSRELKLPTQDSRLKTNVRNIKLTLEYDGAAFYGFQRQPHHRTIQQVLEEALSKFFDSPMKIGGASSRTDAGVHALCQVVHFKTKSKHPLPQIQRGLNFHLPQEVAVREVEEVPLSFHARFDAKSKIYEYRIWNDPVRSPLTGKSAFHVPFQLNTAVMRLGAKILTGKHDFRSFCGADSAALKKGDTVRTVKKIEIKKSGSLLKIRVEGDGFLNHMVRNFAGTLIEMGAGKVTAADLKEVLNAKDRRKAGRNVPAHALCLMSVKY